MEEDMFNGERMNNIFNGGRIVVVDDGIYGGRNFYHRGWEFTEHYN